MYGWTAAEVLGQPLKIIPGDAAHEHAAFKERLLRGETVRGVESRRVRKDGRTVISSFSGSPLRNADGQIYAMVGVHVDVTSQRAAEDSLRQERDFNAAIIETVGALVVVLDPYGRIERFNSACEKATGYLQAEVVGRFFFELFRPEEDWEAVRASPRNKARARAARL